MQPPGVCPRAALSTYVAVLRVKVPKNLSDLADPNKKRRVSYKLSSVVDYNDDPDDLDLINDGSTQEYKTNPLHIDISTLSKIAIPNDRWIMVRVLLEDRDLKFLDVSDEPTPHDPTFDDLHGINYSKLLGTISWICQPPVNVLDPKKGPIADNLKNKSILTFFIKRGANTELPINFVIIPRDSSVSVGAQTPILIDPKIYNDG
jgi:hypothetical protein